MFSASLIEQSMDIFLMTPQLKNTSLCGMIDFSKYKYTLKRILYCTSFRNLKFILKRPLYCMTNGLSTQGRTLPGIRTPTTASQPGNGLQIAFQIQKYRKPVTVVWFCVSVCMFRWCVKYTPYLTIKPTMQMR